MGDMFDMNALPQELIEEIVSRTSPVHACGKLSLVSRSFRSAAKSDHVWERFLPLDIISRWAVQDQRDREDPGKKIDSDTLPAFPIKKDLYLFLSDNRLSIHNGDMDFWLDKLSGKKCFRMGTLNLTVGDRDSHGWKGATYHKHSRYYDVLELVQAVNLEIEGKISTSLLSPNTTYAAYLLFAYRSFCSCSGFGKEQPLETCVGIDGHGEGESKNRIVYIPYCPNVIYPRYQQDKPVLTGPQYPVRRKDELYEVELGDYLNKEGGDNRELRMSLREVKSGNRKSGISLFGIEIRPKSCTKNS